MFLKLNIVLLVLLTFIAACAPKQKDSFESMQPVVNQELAEDNQSGVVAGQVVTGASKLDYEEKVDTQKKIIRQQELELKRQQDDINHLRRQEYYNKALEKYQK